MMVSLSTVASGMLPKTRKGAAISPMLKFSMPVVNLYSGLVDREVICRASLEFAMC